MIDKSESRDKNGDLGTKELQNASASAVVLTYIYMLIHKKERKRPFYITKLEVLKLGAVGCTVGRGVREVVNAYYKH